MNWLTKLFSKKKEPEEVFFIQTLGQTNGDAIRFLQDLYRSGLVTDEEWDILMELRKEAFGLNDES